MGEHVIKLPDVGEGVAEAELVEWHVKPGDIVREDAVLAAVMTDKATVEIPSPVDGTVIWLGAEVGEIVAVGTPIVKLAVEGAAADGPEPRTVPEPEPEPGPEPAAGPEPPAPTPPSDAAPQHRRPAPDRGGGGGAPRAEGERPLAAPAVRLRAREAGIDLRQVSGSGPAGRITHDDLDGFLARDRAPAARGLRRRTDVEEIRITGLRRRIAEKMSLSKSRIPHITYVEEIDVTALEELRARLNAEGAAGRPRLTILPFLMRAVVRAIEDQPEVNAHFDDEAGVIRRHGGVHIGVAAQTGAGLMVPVVRHAEARDLRDCAAELARLSEAAKAGTATREELTGSTITITSLGAMGGIVTTPVINHPEVAIVGVNKIAVRPVWDGRGFEPRKMMNLSSAFDHRVIDGWNAAIFVQRIKTLLETPAMIFMEA